MAVRESSGGVHACGGGGGCQARPRRDREVPQGTQEGPQRRLQRSRGCAGAGQNLNWTRQVSLRCTGPCTDTCTVTCKCICSGTCSVAAHVTAFVAALVAARVAAQVEACVAARVAAHVAAPVPAPAYIAAHFAAHVAAHVATLIAEQGEVHVAARVAA